MIDDDDIDYEQLFDDHDIITTTVDPKIEIRKPVKRVRFAPLNNDDNASPTPNLPQPLSERPRFEIEFDFDSLGSPSNVQHDSNPTMIQKTMDNHNWKNAFLSDLQTAKTNQLTTAINSPSTIEIDSKMNEDTLWDYLKESNPELFEKLQQTYKDKQQHHDRFSVQEPTLNDQTVSTSTVSIIEIRLENGIKSLSRDILFFLLQFH